jgi:Leucine-rich repeat (LRR) protein
MFFIEINGNTLFFKENSTKIDLSFYELHDLPDLSSLIYLKELILNNNHIKKLDFKKLPSSLKYLWIQFNLLEYIDRIPPNLEIFYCSNNHIKNIDLKNSKLSVLDCSYNIITKFDYLPDSILALNCSHNYISTLDNLPSKIDYLNSTGNNIPFYDLKFWKGITILKKLYFVVKYGKKVKNLFYQYLKSRKYELHNELLYKPELGFYKLQWCILNKYYI